MDSRQSFALAAVTFAAIYGALTIAFGLFVVDWSASLGVVFFLGFEMVFISVANDLTELLMSAILSARRLPKVSPLRVYPRVALVMTVCDDVFRSTMESMRRQTYANCDIFILDDSGDQSSRDIVDRIAGNFGYAVVRRNGREGFKAGNINHWLKLFSPRYKYLVVLDSDSLIEDDFITCMVEYAENSENRNVALFQSKVLPWNTDRRFSRILGAMAPMRMKILEKTADRMGTLFSFGHNYLARVDSIIEVGGFPEEVTAEDTALTMLLSANGYSVRLVDTVSYDTEPQDMFLYARRTTRWAKQTVEMFRFPWRGASLRLKLLLCYHLYSYAINVVYFMLLLLFAWAFEAHGWTLGSAVSGIVASRLYMTPGFILLGCIATLWIVQLLLRTVLAAVTGVSLKDIALHCLIVTPLMYSFVFRMTLEMMRTALGGNVAFKPTNSTKKTSATDSLLGLMHYMRIPLLYGCLIGLGVMLRNHYMLYSPNFIWLFLLLISPALLWLIGAQTLRDDGHCRRPSGVTE